jgi:hypothetical protein
MFGHASGARRAPLLRRQALTGSPPDVLPDVRSLNGTFVNRERIEEATILGERRRSASRKLRLALLFRCAPTS